MVSWSWGGLSSLFAAARDRRIDALVEMDGSIRYYPGLVKRAGDVHPERMTIALLCFTRNVSLEDLENDGVPPANKVGPNILNAWTHGDLLTVNMLGMAHPEFSSMFRRKESAQRFAENQVADYEREDANKSYAWVALYILNFLDAYLKHDASANAFLEKTPAENGVPKHFMSITFRPAQVFTDDGRGARPARCCPGKFLRRSGPQPRRPGHTRDRSYFSLFSSPFFLILSHAL